MKQSLFKRRHRTWLGSQRGLTLIELLAVIIIIGILASIAYPSYLQYIIRSKRTAAKSMLLQVADRQELYFADNKGYSQTLTALGFPAATFMIDDNGAYVQDGSSDRIYQITLSDATKTTFTVNAVPQLAQGSRDTACQTLTLEHTGLRSQTGTSTDCW